MASIEWPRTLWSEARQVNGLNDWPVMPGDDAPPERFFQALRAEGRAQAAAMFLAQALSRYDAVAWAASAIRRVPAACPPHSQTAMAAVDAWLAEAGEGTRRAAGDAAGPIDPPTAATLCALAVYYSGGSITPPGEPPVAPHRGATGRFAGAAIITATALADHPDAELTLALDAGERMARGLKETGG